MKHAFSIIVFTHILICFLPSLNSILIIASVAFSVYTNLQKVKELWQTQNQVANKFHICRNTPILCKDSWREKYQGHFALAAAQIMSQAWVEWNSEVGHESKGKMSGLQKWEA